MNTTVRKTTCIVMVDGQDISSALLPRLINLSITDKAGVSSDTIRIELDDGVGAILLPSEGAILSVSLGSNDTGAAVVFRGVVDEVRSSGSRSAGRVLSISGKGFDAQGKAKQQQQKHWDGTNLGDVFSEAAKLGGIENVRVDEELKSIIRPYWAMQGESFIHFGERVAREIGATFKISNDVAILAKRNGGRSAGGQQLAVVQAVYGENLISWDIAPVTGRPRYSKARTRWYDKKTGTWKTEEVEIEDEKANAEFTSRYPAGDADEAKRNSESRKADSERGKGEGSITIDGNSEAQPEGTVVLTGARPGIDGTYRTETVQHDFSRNTGWITRIDLKQPSGDAGKDKRKTSG
ncbi:late control protein (plasmid) [Pseudochrobactrum algeriensis]|uniref:phage late control D family protein n=1 Tax=Pseudochrobactrum algeriensis TaxID=2834768 RepID=UPI001BCC4A2B|nr:contractile injection system protein, VgrG/Pvc8 family [Pseudochrobactrum algeriensis]QVQ35470.1 late control protein [Pseudochrobactrum algeriensis]QVQ42086.1 late control protein [Pseudochrobactrum algeriensis]QVQ42344.1 late control protein [Pseudochrobactrum algeriensis]